MSELGEGAKNIWGKIRSLGKRPEIIQPPQAPVIEDPTVLLAEKTPDIPAEVKPEPEIVAEPIKEKELRPANRIFFHTTPSDNIAEIRQKGLWTYQDHDILSRDLFYSLGFPAEYSDPNFFRLRRHEILSFSLTIWQDSANIKRVEEAGSGKGYTGISEVDPDQTLPKGFLQTYGFDRDKKVKIPAEDFLAAVAITEELEDLLAEIQLRFLYNWNNPEFLEDRLKKYCEDVSHQVAFREGYTASSLAHDLMSSIEQTALRVYMRQVGGSVKRAAEELASRSDRSIICLIRDLADIWIKAERVNEPVSKEYLWLWKQRIMNLARVKGVEMEAEDAINKKLDQKKRWDGYRLGTDEVSWIDDYWGSGDGFVIAKRVARRLGL